ncbi:MAG: hypothetical protein SP4CHLAM5_03080 [Chlamydiia bacterium]|nr:hypothetical protein [Chlamydiia bacterium]MCH9618182.1 hypothetical protein [Chlamydiia bacterium]
MSKWILTLTAITCSIFASNVSENLSYKDKEQASPKNIGHFIISTGGINSNYDYKEIIPIINLGYQSKMMNASLFQSASIEWSCKVPFVNKITKSNDSCEKFARAQIMGLHYFQKEGDSRLFCSVGAHSICYLYIEDCRMTAASVYFGPSIAVGIETGHPSGMINIFKVNYDHPAIGVITDEISTQEGRFSLTFGLGF